MLLLIIPENGARCRTYGCEALNFANMICPFWCFVIVLTCSWSASADMDLYPESKYYIPNAPYSDYDNVPLTTKKWKNPNISPLQDDGDSIDKSSEREYDYAVPVEESETSHRSSLDGILKFLRNHARGMDNTIRNYHTFHRQLPEMRPNGDADDYVDEENDTMEQKWLNDEIERNTQRILRKLQESSRKKIVDHLKNSYNAESSESPEPGNLGEQEQVIDEQINFAFVPTDPRYYADTQSKPIAGPQTASESISPPAVKPILPNNISDGTNPLKIIEIPLRRDHTNSESQSSTRKYFRHDLANGPGGEVFVKPNTANNDPAGVYIIAIVAGIGAAATVGLIAIAIGWYKFLQLKSRIGGEIAQSIYFSVDLGILSLIRIRIG